MKRKTLILLTLIILITPIGISFVKFSHIVYCVFVNLSDFNKKADNIYFSPYINDGLQDSLLILVEKAEERNLNFWGKHSFQYNIIFCSKKDELKKYTGNSEIQTVNQLTPLGSYIVLGEAGYDIDIISHEICHSVILNKLGYHNRSKKIPVWFDEGVALQLDNRQLMVDTVFQHNYRTDYSLLYSISNYSDFYQNNWDDTKKNYLISKYELKEFIDVTGKSSLLGIIDSINNGAEFITTYKSLKIKGDNTLYK